jgi:hypothetical protein
MSINKLSGNSTSKIHVMTGESSLTMTATALAAVRANFSITHLLSAAYFSRNTGAIESANAGKGFGDFFEDIQTNAIATVLTSVAGLEAYANELFADRTQVFTGTKSTVIDKLWELSEQKPILEKYDLALLLLGASPFDRGEAPYQDLTALIKLRNALTHYKPEWSDQQFEHKKISSVLYKRAEKSKFFGSNESLFPRAWATHGTTSWVINSTVKFLLDFEKRADLKSRINPFLDRLNNV